MNVMNRVVILPGAPQTDTLIGNCSILFESCDMKGISPMGAVTSGPPVKGEMYRDEKPLMRLKGLGFTE